MSLIFMDGMYYPTNDLLLKYSTVQNIDGISTETSRVGPGSIAVDNGVISTPTIDYSPPHNLAGTTIGMRFKNGATLGSENRITLSGSGIALYFASNYSITVTYPGGSFTTDPAVFDLNTWFYLELQYTKGTGTATVTLKINENIPTTGGGAGSATASGLTITTDTTKISWTAGAGGGSSIFYFQDLYICDGLGATNNDFLGDVKVDIMRPDSAGTYTDFTPNVDTNYENVDEEDCDEDATYNESKEIGDKDTYNLSALSITGQEIYGIQQCSVIRKTDASSKKAKQLILSNVTESESSELTLNDTFTGYQRIIEQDPDTATTWIESGVNALESGLEVTL